MFLHFSIYKLSPVSTYALAITARQYGEGRAHFLPSGYKFCWALRVSRYKVNRSLELIPGYKVGGEHWRSVAVKAILKPEIWHDAGF